MVYTEKIAFPPHSGTSTGLDHGYSTPVTPQRPLQPPSKCNFIVRQPGLPPPGTMVLTQPQIMYLNQKPTMVKPAPIPHQHKQFYNSFNALSHEAKVTLSRDNLANKLRENWQKQQPQQSAEPINLDDSLTSLGWLHGMNVMKSVTSPTPPPSPTSDDVQQDVNPNAILTTISNFQPKKPAYGMMYQTTLDRIDYRSNPYVKPPYSYATLICMAIKENGVEKITLSSIYQWITDNFMYYRLADPSWQNSIRHNLSLNKCFQKVPRRKDEPGKGGFWRINPEYNDMLVDGVLKKRRTTIPTNYHPPAKKIKTEPDDPWGKDRPDPIPEFHPDKQFLPNDISAKDLRNGNYSINQLLNQDIMVGGVQIKTEDIIDDNVKCLDEEQAEHLRDVILGDITPPSSGNSNSDNSLDEFFNFSDDLQDSPLDLSTSALDLCVQGVELKPPDWWVPGGSPEHQGGLHTPVHEQDSLDAWTNTRLSVEEAIDAFNIDNLFET